MLEWLAAGGARRAAAAVERRPTPRCRARFWRPAPVASWPGPGLGRPPAARRHGPWLASRWRWRLHRGARWRCWSPPAAQPLAGGCQRRGPRPDWRAGIAGRSAGGRPGGGVVAAGGSRAAAALGRPAQLFPWQRLGAAGLRLGISDGTGPAQGGGVPLGRSQPWPASAGSGAGRPAAALRPRPCRGARSPWGPHSQHTAAPGTTPAGQAARPR